MESGRKQPRSAQRFQRHPELLRARRWLQSEAEYEPGGPRACLDVRGGDVYSGEETGAFCAAPFTALHLLVGYIAEPCGPLAVVKRAEEFQNGRPSGAAGRESVHRVLSKRDDFFGRPTAL